MLRVYKNGSYSSFPTKTENLFLRCSYGHLEDLCHGAFRERLPTTRSYRRSKIPGNICPPTLPPITHAKLPPHHAHPSSPPRLREKLDQTAGDVGSGDGGYWIRLWGILIGMREILDQIAGYIGSSGGRY